MTAQLALPTCAIRIGLLVALGYIATGLAGLALAIPPGYATAVFPAAGIALFAIYYYGYRQLLAVWLGSFGMNLWVTLSSASNNTGNTPTLTLALALIPALIATGSTLQAALGGHILRRTLPPGTTTLGDIQEIGWLLGLGGPVACVVSASCGVLALWALGGLPAQEVPYSWFNWWVGDSIGVMVMLPLLLGFWGMPRAIWQPRCLMVSLPLLLTGAVVVLLFLAASHAENRRIESQFRENASRLAAVIAQDISSYDQLLHQFERAIALMPHATPALVSTFSTYTLAHFPGVAALSVVDIISHDERARYEQTRRRDFPAFGITQMDTNGLRIAALPRPRYYPINTITPLDRNLSALGFDLGSEPVRRKTVEDALISGELEVTSPLHVVQGQTPADTTMLVILKTEGGAHGLVSMVFKLNHVIEARLASNLYPGFGVVIRDVSDKQPVELFRSVAAQPQPAASLTFTSPIQLGNRNWELQVIPQPEYLSGKRSWQAWFVLAGGLLLTSALGALLLLITGRTARVEHLVAERTAQLEEREYRLRAVLGSVVDGIVTLDPQGGVETANPALEKLLGTPASTLTHTPIRTLLPRLDWEQVRRTIQSEGLYCKETAAVRADGVELAVEATLVPLRHDQAMRYVCTLHDLSERDRNDKLKREFVSTVSHELRTPLTSIRGSLGLLIGGVAGRLPPHGDQMLKIAYDNTSRLLALINDLLDVEKLALGKLDLKLDDHPAISLLEQSIWENQGYASQFNIHLQLSDHSHGARIRVDAARFSQVLNNLLSNAIKFSHTGGTVILSAAQTGPCLRIAVQDEGSGIPESFRARMFSKFAQADGSDSRKHPGTGLGLHLCKLLVEGMGGEIGFHSTLGVGTTFYVLLPQAADTPPLVKDSAPS